MTLIIEFLMPMVLKLGNVAMVQGVLHAIFTQYLAPNKMHYRLKTNTTSLSLQICANDKVQLSLPTPIFATIDIPLDLEQNDLYSVDMHGQAIHFHALSFGNPHAVIMVKDTQTLANMDIQIIGSFIENHPLFPKRCNVNFVAIDNPHQISIRVWERGCV